MQIQQFVKYYKCPHESDSLYSLSLVSTHRQSSTASKSCIAICIQWCAVIWMFSQYTIYNFSWRKFSSILLHCFQCDIVLCMYVLYATVRPYSVIIFYWLTAFVVQLNESQLKRRSMRSEIYSIQKSRGTTVLYYVVNLTITATFRAKIIVRQSYTDHDSERAEKWNKNALTLWNTKNNYN